MKEGVFNILPFKFISELLAECRCHVILQEKWQELSFTHYIEIIPVSVGRVREELQETCFYK